MTKKQIEHIINNLKDRNVKFDKALSDEELERIESKFQIRFPDDLREFYKTAFPVSEGFVDWKLGLVSKKVAETILSRLNWPWEGMLFDIDKNSFWRNEWGDQPATLEEKLKIAKGFYNSYPKLIPIYSHRYIPETPQSSGNPIFSVYQMDIIYYGTDLESYFANEFEYNKTGQYELEAYPTKKIEFWSSIVEDENIYN